MNPAAPTDKRRNRDAKRKNNSSDEVQGTHHHNLGIASLDGLTKYISSIAGLPLTPSKKRKMDDIINLSKDQFVRTLKKYQAGSTLKLRANYVATSEFRLIKGAMRNGGNPADCEGAPNFTPSMVDAMKQIEMASQGFNPASTNAAANTATEDSDNPSSLRAAAIPTPDSVSTEANELSNSDTLPITPVNLFNSGDSGVASAPAQAINIVFVPPPPSAAKHYTPLEACNNIC